MTVPHSADAGTSSTAVLIPLRSLREGKLRLAGRYDADTRARLIAHMADVVVRAAHDLDVLIVHEDADVADWARARGAAAFRPSAPGLNRAVEEGQRFLLGQGHERVIISHADLPLADDLRSVDLGDGVSIVPDRHGDGTNVMCLPAAMDFTFAYGPGSFAAHVDIARRSGLEPYVLEHPRLSIDVDDPDDLGDSGLDHLLTTPRIDS